MSDGGFLSRTAKDSGVSKRGKSGGRATAQESAILAAWTDIERFQMVAVPSSDPHGYDAVADLADIAMEGWPPTPRRRRRQRVYLSTRVYVACIPSKAMARWLERAFAADVRFQQSVSPRGYTYRAFFDVDDDGWPLPGSLVVAPLLDFALAVGRAAKEGAVSDGAVRQAIADSVRLDDSLNEAFEDKAHLRPEDVGPLRHTRAIACALATMPPRLGWRNDAREVQMPTQRVRAQWVREGMEPEPDLLASFFIDDLRAARTSMTAPLRDYLSGRPGQRPEGSCDIADRGPRHALAELGSLPRAAWAADYPLRLSQQFAVTAMLRDRDTRPIMSVNGPPGTGKTTMLRDLYANLVTERAAVMCTFERPELAFGSSQTLSADLGKDQLVTVRLYPPAPSLCGWEMLVASSNNAAVENVTRELPGASALGTTYRSSACYFAAAAQTLFEDEQVWGLAAGVLGKRSNVSNFVRDAGMFTARGQETVPTLMSELRAGAQPGDWEGARERFREAQARVEAAVAARSSAADTRRALVRAKADREAAQVDIGRARDELERLRSAADDADRTLKFAQQAHTARKRDAAELRAAHPGLRARITRSTTWQDFAVRRKRARERTTAARRDERAAEHDVAELSRRIDDAHVWLASAEEREAVAAAAAAELATNARMDDASIVDDGWHARDRDEQEMHTAWVDADLQRLRVDLFLAALQVHEAFARSANKQISANLRVWKSVVLGELDEGDRSLAGAAAWRSLFLIVPVISTTFASLGRLLEHLGHQPLGWMIVDEAGQATPQAAVGGLLRFRRAVIVGDPDQLEPVVTLPDLILDRLVALHNAPRDVAPHRTSVQGMADARAALGTHRGGRWIGLPLPVHNRCVSPMFDIANAIAYDNQMLQGRRGSPDEISFPLGPSCWIDVPHRGARHWNPADGTAVRVLLEPVVWSEPMTIALLSPFREVAHELSRLVEDYLEAHQAQWSPEQAQRARSGLVAGTIHTFQGKERDAVILVLGGATAGARAWVTSKPNLLNVAVTRACDRIYVVGNRGSWTGGHAATLHRLVQPLPPDRTTAA